MSGASEPVGFAVVGLGMGFSRAKTCLETAGAKLAAVCDIDEVRGRRAQEQLGVPWVREYEQVLRRDDVDVVFLLTPSGMHGEMGAAAAGAGKHVICTKPLDVTLEACDGLIRACEEAGVLLAVDFQERYELKTRRMRAALAAGLLGDLILVEARLKWFRGDAYYEGWHGTWKYDGGGSLMNQTVHLIDLLQWFGGPVERVFGQIAVRDHKIETEDVGTAVVRFANGAFGSIVGTTTFPANDVYEFEVHGTKAAAGKGRLIGDYWRSREEGVAEPAAVEGEPGNVFEDVVRHLRGGAAVACDGREGRKSVELILAIYKSAAEGRPVKLPLDSFAPPKS
jgi:UDP-N-acetyl-2-amino-2-deoxyglucuronate dehydrogenase